MAAGLVLLERISGVAKITLNRPDVLNSLNAGMAEELLAALGTAASDSELRAVLITGAGRAFCAGQDLDEVAPKNGKPGAKDLGHIVKTRYNPIILAIRTTEKPVLCAVNGVAAGAGANIALACDIVLASEKASFIQSFSKVGLIPDSGGTYFLPRLVGLGRAAALCMLAEKIGAKEAQNLGLVYKVFEESALQDESLKIAKFLASQPTTGLGLTKRALNQSYSNTLQEQLLLEEELQRKAGNTHDYNEGVSAFLEKREPNFSGR